MEIHQYQVVIVNLNPTVGSEIKKTGPCRVISPDDMNENLRTGVVAPLTSTKRNYPTRTKIIVNEREGRVALDQIRVLDKKRIVTVLGEIQVKELLEVKSILSKAYVK